MKNQIYFTTEPTKPYTHLRPFHIETLENNVFPDCTYMEHLLIKFWPCDNEGLVNDKDCHCELIFDFEMETGYLEDKIIEKNLLRKLKYITNKYHCEGIYHIEKFLEAFKYRHFYSNY